MSPHSPLSSHAPAQARGPDPDPPSSLWIALAVGVVETCRSHAVIVVSISLALAAVCGVYAYSRIGIDTSTDKMISAEVPWRKRTLEMDRAFPQLGSVLAVVIDAPTPDQADDAATRLAERLAERSDLFRSVRRPNGGEFFRRNGLMFLSPDDLQATAERIIEAQPLIGTLAADPSLRGLFQALNLAFDRIATGEEPQEKLERALAAIADAIEGTLAGRPRPLSWQNLMTGRNPTPEQLRQFILVQPALDFRQLSRGSRATSFVRAEARALGLDAEAGVKVRLTGSVALNDEEFQSVRDGAEWVTLMAFLLVCALLFIALRSPRIIAAIVVTLLVGLVMTAGFAAATVVTLNPISIAFAALFVGMAVDFGIQVSIRYRDERFRAGDPVVAMRRTAAGISGPLLLAAVATSVGFIAFIPTDYVGVSQLGLIASASMLIAVILNLTLLPALLWLFRPAGEKEPAGYAWALPIDTFLVRRRRPVIAFALALAAIGAALAPTIRFDFNPINLRNPKS